MDIPKGEGIPKGEKRRELGKKKKAKCRTIGKVTASEDKSIMPVKMRLALCTKGLTSTPKE